MRSSTVGAARQRRRFWIGGLLLSAMGACWVLYSWGWSIDDPWIAYRYAENLAAGKGLTFNPGERVEGYSSFAHVAALAGARVAGLDVDRASRGLGISSHLLAIWILWAWGWRRAACKGERRPGLFIALAPALLAAHAASGGWAVGGLETCFYALTLLISVLLYLREERTVSGFRWSALFLFLTALVRIEAPLVFFCLAGHQALLALRHGRLPARRTWVWAGVFVGLYGAYTVFRVWYFGALLPNTFYAKATGPLAFQWLAGGRYLASFVQECGVAPLVICVLPLMFRTTRRESVPVWMILAGQAAFIVYCGGDWMPMRRFIVPIIPLIALLFQEGARGLWSAAGPGRKRLAAGAATALAAILAASSAASVVREFEPIKRRVERGVFHQQYFEVGRYLKEIARPGQWLAGEEAGIIPYVSGLPFIDLLGIVDAHMARADGSLHNKRDADYVFGRAPDYLLIHGHVEQVDGWWVGIYPFGAQILADPRMRRMYELEKTFRRGDEQMPDMNYFLLFRRREADALK